MPKNGMEEKPMKKIIALVVALVMVLGLAVTASADELLKIGYVQVGHESDWRMANTQNYFDVFTKDAGFELELIDCDNDHALQLAKVREFVQKDFDYIVIDPIQTAGWDDVLKEVQEAGIPCIIADRSVDASDELYTTAVGTDMTAEGVTAGKWLEEYLAGAAAKILVIEGSTGSSAAIGRAEGFNQVAAAHPEWEILASQDGDFTQNGGQAVMEDFIKRFPEFDVVVCHNDNEAYGAMDAMDAAGIKYGVGEKIIISFDATHEGLTRTLNGQILCDVECNPIQAVIVMNVIKALQAGEEVQKFTLVPDEGFCAPGIESAIVTVMSDEVLAGRKY
jgi:simple sugar transport system substrate-binding protein